MALEQKISLSYWYRIKLPTIFLNTNLNNLILHAEEIGSKVIHLEAHSN